MSSSFINYELIINIKTLDIINIRQSGFYQIRLSVYQTNDKQKNTFAIPFLMLKSEIQKEKSPRMIYESTNAFDIDYSNNTFLTSKFVVRNIDIKTQINQICIFKGSLLWSERESLNKQIKIYAQMLNYQQNEVQVVTEWEGNTLDYVGHSYCPIYFNSYKFTCNLNATVHCIISSISLDNLLERNLSEVKEIGNFKFYQKYSKYIEESIEQMKSQLVSFKEQKSKNQESSESQFEELNKRIKQSKYRLFEQHQSQSNTTADITPMIERMNKMQGQAFIGKFKESIYLLNQIVYAYWKNLQFLLMNKYTKKIQNTLKSSYLQQLNHYHQENIILQQENEKPVKNNQESKLFMYPFQAHQTFIKIKNHQIDSLFKPKEKSLKKHLIVFVHGYQASSFDMEPLSNYLKYKHSNIISLLSTVNEGRTEQEIEESAHRLAIEIKNYINSLQLKEFDISFICHSLGGIIGRACLKYLQLHKEKFKNFVSLCSPHLGYLYHSSTLISTSLWILNKVKKDPSMIELTMEDNQELNKTYLYKLAQGKELGWFKKIWLVGSKEDEYVPYWSAILEEKYFFFQTKASKIYTAMLQNVNKDIQQKINRIQLIFNEKSKDLSNFIGRTAHIKILNYIPGIQLFSEIFTL